MVGHRLTFAALLGNLRDMSGQAAGTRRRKLTSSAANVALAFTEDERSHAALVISVLAPAIDALARALPNTEVVLHELTKLPHTIVAIAGSLTARRVGGPPTDLGLRVLGAGWSDHLISYATESQDGQRMRSSSILFYAPSGRPVASLCFNSDISDLERARDVLVALTATSPLDPSGMSSDGVPETFPASVEALAEGLMRDAVAAVGVPIGLMKKTHKLAIVRDLEARGFFAIREAVDLAAQLLEVSRFTIYNYLKELQAGDTAQQDGRGGS